MSRTKRQRVLEQGKPAKKIPTETPPPVQDDPPPVEAETEDADTEEEEEDEA